MSMNQNIKALLIINIPKQSQGLTQIKIRYQSGGKHDILKHADLNRSETLEYRIKRSTNKDN